jgi:hypothetical protein
VHVLSDREVLRAWEIGFAQHPVDRALTMLAAAFPELDRNRLAAMSVGRRDSHLMDARQVNFGSWVSGVVECPGCGELLEWALDLDDLRSPRNDAVEEVPNRFTLEGYEITYRSPDSTDLAAVVRAGDVASGRAALLRRCVLEASTEGVKIEPTSLPKTVVLGLATEMETRDPQAEILLDFECPACGVCWQFLFDVLEFLWADIQTHTRRLLGEVHDLARAYGWSETDILEMSPVRRRFYLEAAT